MALENIPKSYGGKLDWNFFDEPAYDDEIKRIAEWENGYTSFPPGPCHWRPTEDGTRLECLAVGSQDGQERRVRVCTIPKAFPSGSESDTLVTDGETEAVTIAGDEDAATETTSQAVLPMPDSAEITTVESTADAVAGLVITDAKDSTEPLAEKKIAEAADAATETKAH